MLVLGAPVAVFRIRSCFAALSTALAALALSACDSGPDYFKELSITYEIEGEVRSPSWVFSCTNHVTGAGGYMASSSSGFGERLPSGEAVLFMMRAPTCYGDWRTPFGPQLSADPDQRLRQIRPIIIWMDDADAPTRMESSLLYAHEESPRARIKLHEMTLSQVDAGRPTSPAPGVDWVLPPHMPRGEDTFIYDVASVLPREVWSRLGHADAIAATPAGEPLSGEIAARLPLALDAVWSARPFHNTGELVPAVGDRRSEIVREAADWVRAIHYDGDTLVIDPDSDASDVVFRARPEAVAPEVKTIRYGDEEFTLPAPLTTKGDVELHAAIRVPGSDEVILVDRTRVRKYAFWARFGGK